MKATTRKPLTKGNNKKGIFGGLWFTLDHSGKMEDIKSLSTLASANPICQVRHERSTTDCVCRFCFSYSLTKMRESLRQHLAENLDILTHTEIPTEQMPIIPDRIFRLESFGDIANTTQARNYLRLVRANPKTTFAWWTKNLGILIPILEDEGKPKNLVLIQSSPALNTQATPRKYVDKVFTVYDKQTAKEQPEIINCGARSCITCQRCYKHNRKGVAVEFVNEILK